MDKLEYGDAYPRGNRHIPVDRPLKVLKFGGTSVGEPARLRRVVEIVRDAAEKNRLVVIASAASGVTDALVSAWDTFGSETFSQSGFLEAIKDRYLTLARDVLKARSVGEYEASLEERLASVREILARMQSEGKADALRDALLAEGERFSVPLVALALRDAGIKSKPVDAARLIRTDANHGEALVDFEQTRRQIAIWHRRLGGNVVPVVTGFIGSTESGAVTTLGRGGSDYSAALLASALEAAVMERWTDTDGIYTEDPRKNKDAKRLAFIVLEEAWAWNHAGRLGMHRKALDPLVGAGIPVHVRSTATPDKPGTLIVPAGHDHSQFAVAL